MKKITGLISFQNNLKFKSFLISFFVLFVMLVQSATFTTAGSGNWNSIVPNAPWPLGIPPGVGDDVVISNGNTINLTTNQTIVNITLNGSGVLNLNTATRTLTINGNLTMNGTSAINGNGTDRRLVIAGNFVVSGTANIIQNIGITVAGSFLNNGTVTLNTANTATKIFGSFTNNGTFTNNGNNVPLTVNGNFTNNGTFTQGTGRVTFTGATSNTVSGTAATTAFGGGITVNKGVSQNNILEVTCIITMVNGGLILSNGTFKLSSASTIVPFTADPTIGATERLWVNGGTINSTASIDWTMAGALRVDAGSLNFGTALDDRIAPNSTSAITGLIEVNGGTLSATGRISSGVNPWIYTMTGGLVQLGTIGNTTGGRDVFNLDNSTNGIFSMSGGTLVICNKGGSAGENLGYHNTASLGGGFTGGLLQMGTSTTTAGSILRIESSIPIYNLLINAPGSTVQAQSPLTPTTTFVQITNDITIQDGTFDASFLDIEVGGDWTNASSVADPLIEGTGARRVTFDGTATQTISNTGVANGMVFNNIVVNNTSTVIPQIEVNTSMRAGAGLTLTAGKVDLNANTFTLGTSGTTPGTLLRTADYLYGGTFTRWFGSASFAIANVAGLFPLGTSVGDYRPLWVAYSAALTTTGVISAAHTATYPATYVSASHVDASWSNTLQGVSNSVWTISTSTLAFNGATGIVRYGGEGYGTNTLADLDASLAASVIGTHGAATNVNTTYEVNRTALSTANIANAWRIGTRNVTASPLPITLLDFKAVSKESHVDLIWRTATEKNCDYFTIERSTDGIIFAELSRIKGAGNSSSNLTYNTIDSHPFDGINYYRLKQTDLDGTQSYYKILAVKFNSKTETVLIFPNPSNGKFGIKLNNDTEVLSVEIVNTLGEIVYSSNVFKSEIDLSDKSEGAYLIRIQLLNKTLTQKLILKN